MLSCRQTERGGKAFWDAEESDCHLARCWDTRIASEPLSPRRREWARCARENYVSLAARLGAGGMLTSIRWCRTNCMQARRCSLRLQSRQSRGAGPTWRGWSNTLTCSVSSWRSPPIGIGGATGRGGNCGCWPHTPHGGFHRLLCVARAPQRLMSRTAQCPIGLEGKVLSREATSFPGRATEGVS